jgi:hypothetical protein
LKFESYNPEDVADLAAELDLEVENLGGNAPPVQWFDAAEGQAAVQALLAHLRAHPNAMRRQQELVDELTQMELELSAAVQAGVRFRFANVP